MCCAHACVRRAWHWGVGLVGGGLGCGGPTYHLPHQGTAVVLCTLYLVQEPCVPSCSGLYLKEVQWPCVPFALSSLEVQWPCVPFTSMRYSGPVYPLPCPGGVVALCAHYLIQEVRWPCVPFTLSRRCGIPFTLSRRRGGPVHPLPHQGGAVALCTLYLIKEVMWPCVPFTSSRR